MWDDLFEDGGFFEGAWESISTGVQNGIGDWASSGNTQTPAATVTAGQTATTTAATTAVNAQAAAVTLPDTILGIDSKMVLAGVGLALAVILVMK